MGSRVLHRSKQLQRFPLAERWNGTSWQIVRTPSPNAVPFNFGITRVAPAPDSAHDLRSPRLRASSAGSQPLTPMTAASNADLQDVAAVTATDDWAVGQYYSFSGGYYLPLIEHWNGSTWSVAANPAVPGGHLFGVKAVSASDIWAVGRVHRGR